MRRLIERRRGYDEAGGPEHVKPLPACEKRVLVAVVDRVDRCAALLEDLGHASQVVPSGMSAFHASPYSLT